MGIALVASTSAAQGASGGTTSAINTTGATLIIVSVASYHFGSTPIVSDNKGNTYTGLTSRFSNSPAQQFFYVLAPTVGSGHTITVGGSSVYDSVIVYAFSGVGSYQTENGATGTFPLTPGPLATGSVTPSANGALVVTSLGSESVGTDTIPTGFTGGIQETYVAGVSMQTSAAYLIQTTAAAINPTWTFTGSHPNAIAAVAVFLPAATGLARVQATGKVVADNASSVTLTFPSPPTVGNAVVVTLVTYRGVLSCSDNRGNTYTLAKSEASIGFLTATIYYCPVIAATGAPFTITVLGSSTYFVATAIEVSGVGPSPGLVLDRTAGAGATSGTAVATGATAALTAAEELLVACCSINGTEGSITVDSVSPAWTQEAEELNFTHAVGEADSRIVTGALGTTPSGSWTKSSTVGWVAAIATFKATAAGATTDARVSQAPVEVLSLPTPSARLTQSLVETLSSAVSLAAPGRVTQALVELLSANPPPTDARVSQLVTELLSEYHLTPDRVTQQALEVFLTTPAALRASQLAVELFLPRLVPLRTTQHAVEWFNATSAALRTSQVLVEIFRSYSHVCPTVFAIDDDRVSGPGVS